MKRIYGVFFALLMILSAGCAAVTTEEMPQASLPTAQAETETEQPSSDIAGNYTYTFDGMMGEETMQFAFDDGMVSMSLPDNAMITDVYSSAYTMNADASVSITGFVNTDAASPYPIPGLWDWIDSDTGACTIVLDQAAGTFAPMETEAAAWQANGGEDAALCNIAYASNSPAQTMDILLPDGDGPFPLVILVHGGGFQFGDKQMDIVQRMFCLKDAGFALATINYRLSSETVFPAAVADVKAAIRFLRANAEEYRLDAERFAIWGESAGAYLAAMSAVSEDAALQGDVTDYGDVSSRVSVLIDFYGPISFYLMDEDAAAMGQSSSTNAAGSFESNFIGKAIGELTGEEKGEIDPITYLSAERPLAVWIQAGDGDTSVPCMQSERFAKACCDAFGMEAVHFEILSGAGHMDDAFYTSENLSSLIAFLRDHM